MSNVRCEASQSTRTGKKIINGSPKSCAHAGTHYVSTVKYIFMRCKNLAHRSISSEMDSTYGMWTNPKTVRAFQQKCTMIGGLLVVCCHTHTSPHVSLRTNSKCVFYSVRSRANYSPQNFRLLMTSECALAHPTHNQTGDILTHAQNEFPLSLAARSSIFEKWIRSLNPEIHANGIATDILFYCICVVRALNFPIE